MKPYNRTFQKKGRKINKHGGYDGYVFAKSQGNKEAELLEELTEVLRLFKIPFENKTDYKIAHGRMIVELTYNHKKLKQKLKEFRDKKLI